MKQEYTDQSGGNACHKGEDVTASRRFAGFLFAADHPDLADGNYAYPCEQALLDALALGGKSVSYPIRVLRGDILPHVLASRIKQIQIPVKDTTKRSYSHSRTNHVDMRAFATVVGDLSDSFQDGLATVNLVELPGLFGRTNIFCLTLSPMNASGIKFIDAQLHGFRPYLGAVALDAGNPLHVSLFSELLLDCVWLAEGVIYVSRWDTDEGVYEFGINPGASFRVVELPYLKFQQSAPPRPKVAVLSSRGATSVDRLQAATAPTHLEQVAERLSLEAIRPPKFPVDLKIVLPAEEQMTIPVEKLIDYALSDEHPNGRHKAKLFSDLMAISRSEWRFLAYQIRNGLEQARLEKIEATQYGVQYRAQMEIAGINGRVMTIETRWIIRANEPAQLSTAFVASKDEQRNATVAPPPWVPLVVTGSDRWNAIYDLASKAGAEAARLCVPTPMQVEGFPIIMEGDCGGSYVRLDGRTAFGRWLRTLGHASRSYGPGITVSASVNSQSMERAKAYSEAFARVLWLNGIDGAKVETYLS